MSDLRQAAQQALEALQKIYLAPEHDEYIRVWWPACEDAITALRAALAEPVQEPVCEVIDGRGEVDWISFVPPAGTPLYTAPPQRKPLTEEEIRDLWSWAMTAEAERTATTQQHAFARAIERAHGIGS